LHFLIRLADCLCLIDFLYCGYIQERDKGYMAESKTVSYVLTNDDRARLQAIADRERRTLSWLSREAVLDYLEREGSQAQAAPGRDAPGQR
jgi:hypothetical protein